MARCNKCGKNLTFALVKYLVHDFNGATHDACKECFTDAKAKGKELKWDEATGSIILADKEDLEMRKKCNNCGHIMCYTTTDVAKNKQAASNARLAALGSVAGAVNGYYAASAVQGQTAQSRMDQIVDFNKCPACGSIDLTILAKEEYEVAKSKNNAPTIRIVKVMNIGINFQIGFCSPT